MEPETQDTITLEQRRKIATLRIEDAFRRLQAWDGKTGMWFYLSFASTERFLGAAVVFAPSDDTAPLVPTHLKFNPGGEVMFFEIPEPPPFVKEQYAHRLLTREEVDEMDRRLFAEEAAASGQASQAVN